ncbi:hypothetical protein SLEP1_g40704 [Rubroshorea leprosula]|uniref:ABC-type xenobiotic transporter n=1 Tax=Rubroshorea leprosula TaxID=152421 RepID=A0AAV5L4P7_9ROSI|nr:hypothetical protein SLEP1_g40704 [Rubroshorea leprosula]
MEALFGVLLLVHVPNLNPCAGYLIMQNEFPDNVEYEAHSVDEQICPERQANIFSRIYFGSITPLMQQGYRRPITEKDVWKLDTWDQTETLMKKFQRIWAEETQRKKPWPLRALNNSLGGRFWLGGLFKIVLENLEIIGGCKHFIISHLNIVDWLRPFFVCGATLIEPSLKGRITNMITTDASANEQMCQPLHGLWSAPFRIVMSMVLLYQQLGVASLLGALILVLMVPAPLNSFMLNSIPVVLTVVSFGTFTLLGGDLTSSRAFTSLSLFAMLQFPLKTLPNLLSQVVNANVSLKRLEELLLAEERTLAPNPPLKPGLPAISIKNGNFSWDSKAEKPTLSKINLDVPVGSFVAIIGGTGEGKTSLILAMQGELPPVATPSVVIRGTVAYVPQVSWIFNATLTYSLLGLWNSAFSVRDNILFGSGFDQERYWKTIDVTELQHDLDLLPGHDLTEIGERGVNISGGQKQRVSMARAVYSNSDVYIFDDPLSALDAHIRHQVFSKCIKEELQGKTRILVTNQLHFLPQVDQLILVSEGGKGCKSMLIKPEERETGVISWNVLVRYKDALGGLWAVMIVFTCCLSTEVLQILGDSDIDKLLFVDLFKSLCSQKLLSTFSLRGIVSTISLWAKLPLLILFYTSYLYYQSTAREIKRLDSITRSPVYAQFGEALNGLSTISAYKAYDRMANINGKFMDNNIRFTLANTSANHWFNIRLETLGGIMIWLTATFAVMQNGRAENQAAFAATMGLLLSYTLNIKNLLGGARRQGSLAENSLNGVERVSAYIDLSSEAPDVIESNRPPPGWPSSGSIKFEDVILRYTPEPPPVSHGLSFTVSPSEKIGIVGRTGAGKSSMLNALFRIVEMEKGRILIDGYDLAKFGLKDLREALSIIPQSPVLFSGTISDILDKVHLKDIIRKNPLGLNALVFEGGDNFSIGQRQLLSLARALLRRSKILVLDEATAAVDVGTDALIQKTVREEFKSCTMLVIAHRLNTIMDCDRIPVLDAGQVSLQMDSYFDNSSFLSSCKHVVIDMSWFPWLAVTSRLPQRSRLKV